MNTHLEAGRLLLSAVLAWLSVAGLPFCGRAVDLGREPFRPQFHFTPARNWMNDPNGMVWYDDEYHLFYQHNPFGDRWGHMSWGHAVSRDLVHWEHLAVALAEENGVMIFSGSAVVDWKNTSGFGRQGRPPLVAIYTGHYTTQALQNQQIAFSNDKGRTWTKFAGNPVLDLGEKDFRDPKVFWHEPTQRWVMVVSWPEHRKVRFYASPNLREWTHLSDFGPAGSTAGIWECPDLFPLAWEGKTRWVLIVNVGSGAPAGGSGTQYFVGAFDGQRYTLDPSFPTGKDTGLWADFGPDFYAAVSWNDLPKRDGRRLWLGWMSNWQYANDVPTAPWRSAMSMPRELGLKRTAAGLRLVQNPVRELRSLRGPRHRFRGGSVAAANAWLERDAIHGDLLEIQAEFTLLPKGNAGVRLFRGAREETSVCVDGDRGRVYLDRTRSGNVAFHSKFPGVYSAPLAVGASRVRLHLFLDACSVEASVNDGEAWLTALVFPSAESRGVQLFGSETGSRIASLEVWPLRSSLRAP